MSKKKKLKKEDWPGEVVFAIAECDRIAEMVAKAVTGSHCNGYRFFNLEGAR